MRLLVLGGTRFVGRHVVEAALARGHEVTLFTRGKTNPDLFPNVAHLQGDRDAGDLEALKGHTWDAVIDTCGYIPRVVRQSAELLRGAVDRYLFISTISVYADPITAGQDEHAALQKLEDESVEEVTGETYGGLKVLCELAAQSVFGEKAIIVRPGMVVGPHDPTDRFTYWVRRVAQGGEVLAPGTPERPVQMIDGRDLAAFQLHLLEAGIVGVYNATGPSEPYTWGTWLDGMRVGDARFTWIDDAWLGAHEVTGGDLPFWVPEQYADIFAVSVQRGISAGLSFRPFAETVRDTRDWDAARPADTQRKGGLSPERESALLKQWHGEQGG
ncbi:MAG: NAD-dependent epimerase/dehydratase family protein [Anaerolinea sp.]|nr:NAD-dependent epimerase/dehydratase family protein [Anaerolinea sp.]